MESEKENGKQKFNSVAENEFHQFFAMRPNRYGENTWPATIGVHDKTRPDPRAQFAMVCMERWGMVAAIPDGEDSAGRARLRGLSPLEVVNKACDVAELAFAQFKERGWLTSVPNMQGLIDAVQDLENSN